MLLPAKSLFGSDVGSADNWREASKSWALGDAKLDSMPVFIGHCYAAAKQYKEAAKVYSDLYEFADTQGEEADWYECYLAFSAGNSMLTCGNTGDAKVWLARAADFANPDLPKDAIQYYSRKSKEMLEDIDRAFQNPYSV